MEYKPNGNLENAIESKIFENDPTSKLKIIIGIASAIKALHKNNTVHRDLKPVNILLDENNEPVICDFGCSRQYSEYVENNMTNKVGTLRYEAPELIINGITNQIYTYHVDSYSFGVILYQILTNKTWMQVYPVDDLLNESDESIFVKIMNLKIDNILPDDVDTLHPFFSSLIRECWNASLSNRPNPETVYFKILYAVDILGEKLLPGANMQKVNEYIEKLSKYD